jgi:hypothetical protein
MRIYYFYTEGKSEKSSSPLPLPTSYKDYFLLIVTYDDSGTVITVNAEYFTCGDTWKCQLSPCQDYFPEGVCCESASHFIAWRELIYSKFLRSYPFPILTYPQDDVVTREYMDLQYNIVANPILWDTPLDCVAEVVKDFLLQSRLCWPSCEFTQHQYLVFQRQNVDIAAGTNQRLQEMQDNLQLIIEGYEEHLECFQKKVHHEVMSRMKEFKREVFEEMLCLREEFCRKNEHE